MKSVALETTSRRTRAWTLVELMVACSIGMLVLTAVGFMSLYGSRSSAAVSNYTDLEKKSRYALDIISREVRQANAVIDFQTNLPAKSLTLTNSDEQVVITLTYDSNARTLALQKTGQGLLNVLTECDRWDFGLYQRTPLVTATNVTFYPATNGTGAIDPRLCKLINLSWKCSRLIAAQKLNTESVQAAQLVLRNKQ